jgi:L-2,4-diaminobutyrate decarboxylase
VLQAATDALGARTLPTEGIGPELALERVAHVLVQYGLDLSHPRAAAHLQPPTLTVAVAADALASVSNASLDTYDSGPSAIAVERWLIAALIELAGFGPCADGVLTPGGSLSNLLALMLARDAAGRSAGVDVHRAGTAGLLAPVVYCSELAHFSVHRACAALGLGEDAVRSVPSNSRRKLCTRSLRTMLDAGRGHTTPLAIVCTAGTTDFGSIDPLHELADLAREFGVWLHVDAAYGFGCLFSRNLAPLLDGVSRADSMTLDLHKLGFQPAATSVLLLGNTAGFGSLEREVPYLNPSDDTEAGFDGLLGRSLQTTRRVDALKVVASMLAFGKRGLGELVDACHDLAAHAEMRIAENARLTLVAGASLSTVVFRYLPERELSAELVEELQGTLRRGLLERGIALIGRTIARIEGDSTPRTCLKLTLVNPTATQGDIDDLLRAVVRTGRELESVLRGGEP